MEQETLFGQNGHGNGVEDVVIRPKSIDSISSLKESVNGYSDDCEINGHGIENEAYNISDAETEPISDDDKLDDTIVENGDIVVENGVEPHENGGDTKENTNDGTIHTIEPEVETDLNEGPNTNKVSLEDSTVDGEGEQVLESLDQTNSTDDTVLSNNETNEIENKDSEGEKEGSPTNEAKYESNKESEQKVEADEKEVEDVVAVELKVEVTEEVEDKVAKDIVVEEAEVAVEVINEVAEGSEVKVTQDDFEVVETSEEKNENGPNNTEVQPSNDDHDEAINLKLTENNEAEINTNENNEAKINTNEENEAKININEENNEAKINTNEENNEAKINTTEVNNESNVLIDTSVSESGVNSVVPEMSDNSAITEGKSIELSEPIEEHNNVNESKSDLIEIPDKANSLTNSESLNDNISELSSMNVSQDSIQLNGPTNEVINSPTSDEAKSTVFIGEGNNIQGDCLITDISDKPIASSGNDTFITESDSLKSNMEPNPFPAERSDGINFENLAAVDIDDSLHEDKSTKSSQYMNIESSSEDPESRRSHSRTMESDVVRPVEQDSGLCESNGIALITENKESSHDITDVTVNGDTELPSQVENQGEDMSQVKENVRDSIVSEGEIMASSPVQDGGEVTSTSPSEDIPVGEESTENTDKLKSEDLEKSESENLEKPESENWVESELNDFEKPESDNLEKSEVENLEKPESETLEKSEAENIEKSEGEDLENLEKSDSENLEKIESENLEKSEADNIEKPESDNLEKTESDHLEEKTTSPAREDLKPLELNVEKSENESTEPLSPNSANVLLSPATLRFIDPDTPGDFVVDKRASACSTGSSEAEKKVAQELKSPEEEATRLLKEKYMLDESSGSESPTSPSKSPRRRKSSQKDFDPDCIDQEAVDDTVSKMNSGTRRYWYKDLYKIHKNEIEKGITEDKNEDGIEAVPNLRNIRSMFEGSPGQAGTPPAQKDRKPLQIKSRWGYDRGENSPSPPRDPTITRETVNEKETPIDFGGLKSVRARYQQSVQSTENSSKKSFTLQEDLASDTHQRFQPAPSPPRDPSIIKCDQWVEEDLPPAELTSSLVARFKQMENEVGAKTPPLPVLNKHQPSPHVVHDKLVKKQPGRSDPPPPRTDLLNEEGRGSDTTSEWNMEHAPHGSGIVENNPQQRTDVIRENDRNVGEELPEVGMAKNRMAMFKQMESSNPAQPPSPQSRRRPINIPRQVNGNGTVESGVVENEPERKVDVVRETDALDDPKPAPATTKKLLAVFQNLEAQDEANKRNNQVVTKRKASSFKTTPINPALVNNQSNKMKEFTPPREAEVNQQYEAGNEPSVRNPDTIICDQMYDETPEMPEENTTKNLVARFKEIQVKAKEDEEKGNMAGYVPVRRALGEWGRGSNSPTPPPNGNHYQSQVDAGEYSNQPVYNDNVYRESDNNDEVEFPTHGTTNNLKARFQQQES